MSSVFVVAHNNAHQIDVINSMTVILFEINSNRKSGETFSIIFEKKKNGNLPVLVYG